MEKHFREQLFKLNNIKIPKNKIMALNKKERNKWGFTKMMVVKATNEKPEVSFEVFYKGKFKGQPNHMQITARSYAIANAIARNHACGRDYTINEMKPARYES